MNLYELINVIQKGILKKSVSKSCLKKAYINLALLLQPFAPHLSEEIWKYLKCIDMAINQSWPKSDKIKRKKRCKIAIQINGKTREVIEFDVGVNEYQVKKIACEHTKISKIIDSKKIKRAIFVQDKILNLVFS